MKVSLVNTVQELREHIAKGGWVALGGRVVNPCAIVAWEDVGNGHDYKYYLTDGTYILVDERRDYLGVSALLREMMPVAFRPDPLQVPDPGVYRFVRVTVLGLDYQSGWYSVRVRPVGASSDLEPVAASLSPAWAATGESTTYLRSGSTSYYVNLTYTLTSFSFYIDPSVQGYQYFVCEFGQDFDPLYVQWGVKKWGGSDGGYAYRVEFSLDGVNWHLYFEGDLRQSHEGYTIVNSDSLQKIQRL